MICLKLAKTIYYHRILLALMLYSYGLEKLSVSSNTYAPPLSQHTRVFKLISGFCFYKTSKLIQILMFVGILFASRILDLHTCECKSVSHNNIAGVVSLV